MNVGLLGFGTVGKGAYDVLLEHGSFRVVAVASLPPFPELPGTRLSSDPLSVATDPEAELVIELTGSKSKIVRRELPADDPKQRRPDISKAEKLLDWRPVTPLREGLKLTIEYFDRLLKEDPDFCRP